MQGRHLYEYAVIRLVPRVERGERLNIGVILHCRAQNFLSATITVDEQRLRVFAPDLDIPQVYEAAKVFEGICAGTAADSPISRLDKVLRFRWLIAPRSTVIQTSRVHPGFCADAATTLERLHRELVLQEEA